MTETADGIDEVADVTDEQAAAAEEIAATIDEVVRQSNRVTGEMQELATESERQAEMVEEVEHVVRRLGTDDETGETVGRNADAVRGSQTDGGRPLPADLPGDVPDFVIDRLSDEQLRAIAAGRLDADDFN